MTIARSLCFGAALFVMLAGGLSAQQADAPTKGTAKSSEAAPVMRPWPRTFEQDGTHITLHQPQFDDWQGNSLAGRMAIAVKTGSKTGSDGKPHDTLSYGAMWFKARADIDKVARQVTLSNLNIEKVIFPNDRSNEAKYLDLLNKIAKRSSARIVSLDLLESALAINRETKMANSVAVKNDPPDVLFSFEPALLVLIDGNPVLKPSGTAGVERVLNTRSLILKQGDRYFLNFAGRWVTSPDIAGPWRAAGTVSAALDKEKAAAEKSKVVDLLDQPSDALKKVLESGKLPSILVSSKPAELIMVDGDPQFVDVDGTDLAYVANTASDVFVDKSKDNFWYVLMSGRWFSAPSSNGPWTYTAGKLLPADFAKIPPESPKSARARVDSGYARIPRVADREFHSADGNRKAQPGFSAGRLRRRARVQAYRRHRTQLCMEHRECRSSRSPTTRTTPCRTACGLPEPLRWDHGGYRPRFRPSSTRSRRARRCTT